MATVLEELDRDAKRQLWEALPDWFDRMHVQSSTGDETHRYYTMHLRQPSGIGYAHFDGIRAEAQRRDDLPDSPWVAFWVEIPDYAPPYFLLLGVLLAVALLVGVLGFLIFNIQSGS